MSELEFDSHFDSGGHTLRLRFAGRLTVGTSSGPWKRVNDLLDRLSPRNVVVDAAQLEYCDGAGIALLQHCRKRIEEGGGTFRIEHGRDSLLSMLDLYGSADYQKLDQAGSLFSNLPDALGRMTWALFEEQFRRRMVFLGEFSFHFLNMLMRPLSLRWGDTLRVAERVGVDALPIILLIGFLLGLIMAFQSAVPMRIYGAELFVANLIGLSLLRELGPLITSVILAGRTGSSFAAELGTMKINEELDAMTTMGLEPVRFLVLPRVVAAVAMVPLLTIFFNLAGLIGGLVVLKSFGYPVVVYVNQVVSAVSIGDVSGGLFKACVFGALVAGLGCYMGLSTKSGAGAVGESTTRAVVSGIISIAVADGVFAVVFFLLDW